MSELQRMRVYRMPFSDKGDFDPSLQECQNAFLLMESICDDRGDLIYCEDHLNGLANLPMAITVTLIDAIDALNDIDEPLHAKKNSEPTASDS